MAHTNEFTPLDFTMTGQELRAFRKSLGMGTPSFGRLLGPEGSIVRRWEAGSTPIPGPIRLLVCLLRDIPAVRGYLGLASGLETRAVGP